MLKYYFGEILAQWQNTCPGCKKFWVQYKNKLKTNIFGGNGSD